MHSSQSRDQHLGQRHTRSIRQEEAGPIYRRSQSNEGLDQSKALIETCWPANLSTWNTVRLLLGKWQSALKLMMMIQIQKQLHRHSWHQEKGASEQNHHSHKWNSIPWLSNKVWNQKRSKTTGMTENSLKKECRGWWWLYVHSAHGTCSRLRARWIEAP